MAKQDIKVKKDEEKTGETIEIVTPESSTLPPEPTPQKDIPFKEGIAPYIIFLEAMKITKKSLDTAPTFTPKNFYDQIQFYDNAGTYRLYLYVNGDWRYVALT